MSCTSRVLPAAAIAVAALVSGCVSHVHTPYEPSRKTPARDVVSSPPVGSFDYTKGSAGTARRTPVEAETSTHHVWRIAMPSYGDSGQPDNLVAALYYQSRSPGPKALVVVLPKKSDDALAKLEASINAGLMRSSELNIGSTMNGMKI